MSGDLIGGNLPSLLVFSTISALACADWVPDPRETIDWLRRPCLDTPLERIIVWSAALRQRINCYLVYHDPSYAPSTLVANLLNDFWIGGGSSSLYFSILNTSREELLLYREELFNLSYTSREELLL